jgi:(2Fe-2S) ferredoxin
MKTTHLLATLGLAVATSFADQLAYLDESTARRSVDLIAKECAAGRPLVLWCTLCQDDEPTVAYLERVIYQDVDYEGFKEILVQAVIANTSPKPSLGQTGSFTSNALTAKTRIVEIDLAYAFIADPNRRNRFVNLGRHLGLECESRVDSLTLNERDLQRPDQVGPAEDVDIAKDLQPSYSLHEARDVLEILQGNRSPRGHRDGAMLCRIGNGYRLASPFTAHAVSNYPRDGEYRVWISGRWSRPGDKSLHDFFVPFDPWNMYIQRADGVLGAPWIKTSFTPRAERD